MEELPYPHNVTLDGLPARVAAACALDGTLATALPAFEARDSRRVSMLRCFRFFWIRSSTVERLC